MMVQLFGDQNGNVSSMNFVWLLSIVTIIGMWIALSIKLNSLQHVTGGDALWFATLFSGKVLQNFFERKFPGKTEEETSLFQDNQGKTSISRIIWIIAVLGIVFTWAFISWTSSELQHFSTGDAAWFGALFGSKIGGTIIEREFGIKDEDEYGGIYRGTLGSDMSGDSGDGYGDYSSYMTGGTNQDKDELIKHLQETLKVSNQFNKNLVKVIDPNMTKKIKEIEEASKSEDSEFGINNGE